MSLTDKNKDGSIDMNEFHHMLYAEYFAESEDEESVINEVDNEDYSDSDEEQK